ncbi:hypothetical protein [Paenibacillus sp. FSL P4-0184]|uniref:hypothetical protein n=1 Tax=Paenibacillus sp. FSL P4-0184 TaxID=2921632 RepID=UPI0030F926BB
MAVYMSFVKRAVGNALNRLINYDLYLLENDVNERSITHKIGEYLQQEFGSFYSVDCEYNRNFLNIHRSKKIYILDRKLEELAEGKTALEIITDKAYRELSVYPDIIVHKRGKSKNLLVIEVKKSSSRINNDFDFLKLDAYTDPSEANNLHYEYGLFIKLNVMPFSMPELIWFKDGQRIEGL